MNDDQEPYDALDDIRQRAERALRNNEQTIAELRSQRDMINEQLRPLVDAQPMLIRTVRNLTPKDER